VNQPRGELREALLSFLRGSPVEVQDWQGFRELAVRHGVLGIAYPRITSEDGRAALFREYALQAGNTLAHAALFSFLRENAPPFLPLKGISLIARGLYLPQERPLLDLDILVRPERIQVFVKLLSGRGFSKVISTRKGIVLHKGRINLDIHIYPVAPELFVPPEKLWARSRDGFLSPEDDLIITAAHAALASFTFGPRLIWKIDGERLMGLVDPERLLRLARAMGLEACVSGLIFARDEDILRGRRRPSRLRRLSLSWRAGSNKAQRALCVAKAGLDRITR
jgi:hypothetical protein